MRTLTNRFIKFALLSTILALAGTACSKKKKKVPYPAGTPYGNNYYGPSTSCGNPSGYGGAYQGFAVADLGRGGGVIELDMFTMANGAIYAVGELYIANLNEFDPAVPTGYSVVECVEGSGQFVYKSGQIGDEISMTLKGAQGTTIIMGGTNGGSRTDTVWVNDSITGQLHMSLGQGGQMFLYSLSP